MDSGLLRRGSPILEGLGLFSLAYLVVVSDFECDSDVFWRGGNADVAWLTLDLSQSASDSGRHY